MLRWSEFGELMANLGQIQTYISKRLIDPNGTAVSAQDVISGINETIRYYKVNRFWFNEVNDTATLTANSAAFPYPSDFLIPAIKDGGFVIEWGNIRYPLAKIDMPVYDNIYIANCLGLPRWYAKMADSEYQCFPIPNLAYTLNRHYLKEYNDLVNNTDTNDFTTYAERLVELWTLANLSEELRSDDAKSTYYRQAAEVEYRNIQKMTSKQNAAGKVTLWSNL